MFYWANFKLVLSLSLVLLTEQRRIIDKRELESAKGKEASSDPQKYIAAPAETPVVASDIYISTPYDVADIGGVSNLHKDFIKDDLENETDTKIELQESIPNKATVTEKCENKHNASKNATTDREKISSNLNETFNQTETNAERITKPVGAGIQQISSKEKIKDTKIPEVLGPLVEASNFPNKINLAGPAKNYTKKTELPAETVDRELSNTKEKPETVLSSLPITKESHHHKNHTKQNTLQEISSKDGRASGSDIENITSYPDADYSLEVTTDPSIESTYLKAKSTTLPVARDDVNGTNQYITTRRPLLGNRQTLFSRPTSRPGLFPNLQSRPPGFFLPIVFFNRLNNTRPNNTFGFGFFGLQGNRRPAFGTTLPGGRYSDANPTPSDTRDAGFWNAFFNPGRSSIDQQNENEAKATHPESQSTGNVQIVHFYFPLRFPFRAQIVKDTLTDANAAERDVKDQVAGELLRNADKAEESVLQSSNNLKTEEAEKTSLKFEFELPKPVANFVKGIMDTFMS